MEMPEFLRTFEAFLNLRFIVNLKNIMLCQKLC